MKIVGHMAKSLIAVLVTYVAVLTVVPFMMIYHASQMAREDKATVEEKKAVSDAVLTFWWKLLTATRVVKLED